MANLSVLILAAGKGVRMKSRLPKVLHPINGVPMVELVYRTIAALKPSAVAMVVGHQGADVKAYLRKNGRKPDFFTQRTLNGTGGAVRQALSWLKRRKGSVIVTCGDMPVLQTSSLKELLKAHMQLKNTVTILTATVAQPQGYGRIVREGDDVDRIVEELDATDHERNLHEINTGTYCFDAKALARVLPKLKNNNAKKEYYLTDVIHLLKEEGGRVGGVSCFDPQEALGVNKRVDQALAEAALRRRKIEELMDGGVTVIDPATTYVAQNVKVGSDTTLWPQTFLEGDTRIGSGCQIGPWAHIKNGIIENDVSFKASFATDSIIRKGARIGPYSHIRPQSDIGPNVHVGNFSEIKKSRVAEGSKINHLSYLGDAKIGKNVNIGAGTITCNYDGIQKHPTTIENHAFIGSNANLIAPVRIGAHAVVGAGSSISEDVPAWSLAVERSKRITKKGWVKKR